ncbi:MAG: hypothetical protein ABEJ05_02755 [Haloglomus sp.]
MSQRAVRSHGLLSRYDLVLLCIPTAFLIAALAGLFLELPSHAATAGGGLVSAAFLGEALFRNPPLET